MSDYFSQPGLSQSGMKDLAISPYRYWYLRVNPNAPLIEPSPQMVFGSALHCLILEPSQFEGRYARAISVSDFGECLITMDDLRGWLKDHGISPRGVRKADLIAQVTAEDPSVPIFDLVNEEFLRESLGKTILRPDDWDRVHAAADSLVAEPELQAVLAAGEAEVAMTATDPETGVFLKSRMDWVSAAWTLDIKTFSQTRGKSIDETVNDAIWYEGYYRQAYLYSLIRSLQPGFVKPGIGAAAPPFMFAFVESTPPFETRIRVVRAKCGGEVNMLWERARIETRELIRLYAECMEHFGTDKPWRYAQEARVLADEDFRQLAYA